MRGEREHLSGRPTKIVCCPQSNYLAAAAQKMNDLALKKVYRQKALYIIFILSVNMFVIKISWVI